MGAKTLSPTGFEPLTSRSIANHCAMSHLISHTATDYIFISNKLYFEETNRHHSKMKDESVKKSLEKSNNVLEEKRKIVKRKICIQRHTFTTIAMNFVQEQLINLTKYH